MSEGTWYRTGTVSLTNGSDLVSGYGTAFIDNVFVGGIFFSPSGLHEVTRVISDTQLQLVAAYAGPTVAGAEFAVAPTQGAVVAATKQLQTILATLGPLMLAWQSGDLNPRGLQLKGVKATEADLPASGNTAGDAWLVDETMWVWTGTSWHNAGQIGVTAELQTLRNDAVDAKNVAQGIANQVGDLAAASTAAVEAAAVVVPAVDVVLAAADRAESARDSAAQIAGIFDTPALGLAGTTEGQMFAWRDDVHMELVFYKHVGSAAVEKYRMKLAEFLNAIFSIVSNIRSGWVTTLEDGAGNIWLGIQDDGTIEMAGVSDVGSLLAALPGLQINVASLLTLGDSLKVYAQRNGILAVLGEDAAGNIAAFIDDDGNLWSHDINVTELLRNLGAAPEADLTPVYAYMLPLADVHILGDSLSQRLQGHVSMAALFNAAGIPRQVSYDPRGGTNSNQIVRRNGVPLTMMLDGGVIPATTTPVTCTSVTSDFLYSPAAPNETVLKKGWISGVYGTVTLTVRAYSYTRQTAGPAVTVDATSVFTVDASAWNRRIQIVWPGRNDGTTDQTLDSAGQPKWIAAMANLFANIDAYIGTLPTYTKWWLVPGFQNNRVSEAGGLVTFPGNQIPAAGSAVVTVTSNIQLAIDEEAARAIEAGTPVLGVPGVSQGVEGSIAVAGGVYTWTRKTAGAAVAAPARSVFQSNGLRQHLANITTMKLRFGARFIDVHEVLRRLYDAASQDDLDDMAAGVAPRSCYGDLLHQNAKGSLGIGNEIVSRVLFFKQYEGWK